MKRSILLAIATLVLALALPAAAFAADSPSEVSLAPGDTATASDEGAIYTGSAELDLTLAGSYDQAGLEAQAGGMTSKQRAAFNKLLAAKLPKLAKSIDISKLKLVAEVNEKKKTITNGEKALQDPFSDYLRANPDLFYVNNSMRFNAKKSGGKVYFTELIPSYSYKAKDIPAMKKKYEAQLKKIVASIPKGASQAQKAKIAHDWLVINDDYNDPAAEKGEKGFGDLYPWNAYGAIVKGKPVCEGISLGFIAIMKRVGIQCVYVYQKDAKVNHAWNRLKVDGAWYNADITFDENETDDVAKKSKTKKITPEVRYFLKSDAWFKANPDAKGAHKTWSPAGVAGKNTKYDKRLKPSDWVATKPKVAGEYAYSGKAQVALNNSASATRNYSVSGTTEATELGDYTATAELDDDCFWDDGTISDLDFEWAIVTMAKNPMKVAAKSKTLTVKYSKTKARTIKVKKAFVFKMEAMGKVTYAKASGNKRITVSKAGKITVKKGLKRGTYKVKVKVKAAGIEDAYKAKTTKVTLRIKVK